MKLRDVVDALVGEDLATMRRAFGALVAGQEVVEAASPGMLVVALNHLCVALKDDPAEMPAATCGALDLPAGKLCGWRRAGKARRGKASAAFDDCELNASWSYDSREMKLRVGTEN